MGTTIETMGRKESVKARNWTRLAGAAAAAAAIVLAAGPAARADVTEEAQGASSIETPYAWVDPEIQEGVLKMNVAMLDKVEIFQNDMTYLLGYGPPLGTVDVYVREGSKPSRTRIAENVHVKAEGWWEIRLEDGPGPLEPIPVVGFENPIALHFILCWTPMGGQRTCSPAFDDPGQQLTISGWAPQKHSTSEPKVDTWNLRAGVGNYPKILRAFILDGSDRTGDERTNDIEEAQINEFENPTSPVPQVLGVGNGDYCKKDNPLHKCVTDASLTVSSYLKEHYVEFPFVMVGMIAHDTGRSILKVQKFKRSEIPQNAPLFRSFLFGYPLVIKLKGLPCSTIVGGMDGLTVGLVCALAPLAVLALRRRTRGEKGSRLGK